jgi:cellulose 1,4-beta-cellobiosidase
VLTKGITVSPTSLMFTTSNYNVVQTVTVTGIPDDDLTTDPFSLRITAPSLNVTDQFVNVLEIDDDTQAIIISKTDGTGVTNGSAACTGPVVGVGTPLSPVPEGGSVEFCVNLSKQPLSNTVVDVAVSPSILTKLTGLLSFSTGNYSTPQIVRLAVGTDPDANPESGQVDLSSSGFASTRTVTFNITDSTPSLLSFLNLSGTPVDPDPMAIPPTPGFGGTVTIAKGATLGSSNPNAIKVRLTADPISTVVVTCTSNAEPGVQVVGTAAGAYTFTGGSNGSYGTYQPIPIQVASSAPSGNATITCQPQGGNPPLLPWTFTVVVP